MKAAEKQTNKSGKKMPIGRRFKPGQSGNPAGRPKHKTLMEAIREQLMSEGANPSIEDIAGKYIAAMNKGSFQHLKEYIDREQGKVPDRVANADGSNVRFDLKQLNSDELTLLRALRLRAIAQPSGN